MAARPERTFAAARPGLLVLMLSAFAGVTTEMLPVGLLPTISAAFHVTESRTGLVVSLYAATVATMSVPLVLLTRRVPGKRLLLAATGSFAVSNLGASLAPSLAAFAGARALGGVTHALFFSVCIGYGARLAPNGYTGRAFALVSAGASAGFALGVPLATVLGNALGWRAAFGAVTGLMILAFVLTAILLPGVEHVPGVAGSSGRGRRHFATAVGANTLTFLGHYSLYTYVTVLLLHAGARTEFTGPILLLFGAMAVVGVWVAGPQIDRRPRTSALAVLGVIGLGILTAGLGASSLPLVILGGAVWNCAFGVVPSLFQTAAVHARAVSPELTGAWINSTSNIGIGVGSFLGGVMLERFDFPGTVILAAGFIAVAALVVLAATGTFPPTARGWDDPTTTTRGVEPE
ncbi:MAG: MFS transporter [Propionibacterium sp.]